MILLPPSETKAFGGDGGPLELEGLSFPELTPTRRELVERLTALRGEEALRVLGISARMSREVHANERLEHTPTLPALRRYTGVLYDALDAASLSPFATARITVGSALFGLVRGTDRIPHYRLSAGTKLGGVGIKNYWKDQITAAIEGEDGLVVDLRSGAYQALGRVPDAVTVRVTTPQGKVVSHANKKYKGQLARALACDPGEPEDASGVADLAVAVGFDAATRGREVTIVVAG